MHRQTPVPLLLLALAALPAVRLQAGASSARRQTSFAQYVEIPGAAKVGSSECQRCHDAESGGHRWTAHRDVGCEDCHGPGSLHVGKDTYQDILSFGKRPAEAANGVCLNCHAARTQLQGWFSASHQANDVRCVDCHREHVAEVKRDSRQVQNAACLGCHPRQQAEGSLPYHHPVREAKMGCLDCHDPHGGPAANGLKADTLNDLCFRCHAEVEGPFTYQHPPVTENCGTCHTAHGSMQRALLRVSQPMLCLQCHPGHHNGSGVPLLNSCTSCHSSIHGSDVPSATGGSVFIDKH